MATRNKFSVDSSSAAAYFVFFVALVFLIGRCVECGIVVDELGHLPAAISHWKFEKFDLYRVNPPIVRLVAGIPASFSSIDYDWSRCSDAIGIRPEFTLGYDSIHRMGRDLQPHVVIPRIFCLSFWVFGGILLYWWTLSVWGRGSALLVSIFWCSSPSILAYACTIVPDVGSVAMGLFASYAFWLYVCHRSPSSTVLAGLSLGLALLSKLTWLTACVSLPTTAIVCILLMRDQISQCSWLRRIGDLLIAFTIALLVLNAGYLFEKSFILLKDYQFCSKTLGGVNKSDKSTGNRFEGTFLGEMPVPVPQNYVLGIDYLKFEVEQKKWSFLLGEWKIGSWPYYYLLTILFKTPLFTLLAALCGLIFLVVECCKGNVSKKAVAMVMFLAIPSTFAFVSVSLQGGFNHHHRYVLFVYPCLFVLGAVLGANVSNFTIKCNTSDTTARGPTARFALATIFAVGALFSCLISTPHHHSYFNYFAGGSSQGWKSLGFSNIDWGEDIPLVAEWLEANPQCRPVSFDLDFVGTGGELFGMQDSDVPKLPKEGVVEDIRTDRVQWFIVSVKRLYNLPEEQGLEYLQSVKPYHRIAHSYNVYRIDCQAAGGKRM